MTEKLLAVMLVVGGLVALGSSPASTQNRLEHTIGNLSSTGENLVASESRVRDTDMALEMT